MFCYERSLNNALTSVPNGVESACIGQPVHVAPALSHQAVATRPVGAEELARIFEDAMVYW